MFGGFLFIYFYVKKNISYKKNKNKIRLTYIQIIQKWNKNHLCT